MSKDNECHVQVSSRDPRYFELSNGSPYIAIGFNLVGPPKPDELESVIQKMANNRVNYCRVWLGHPDWDIENQKSGVYDNERARVVDKFLQLARENCIRVKMCFEYFRVITAGDTKQSFDKPIHHITKGGPYKNMEDFLINGRQQFKSKLEWYADRYGSDPAVFAWELWNEMDCVQGDWLPWTKEMLTELHRLFPDNLAVQSLGSFDHDAKRESYRTLCALKGNDAAQVHRYLDPGATQEICHGPVDMLAADAVRELVAFNTMKPIILTETGAVKPRHTGCSELYEKDRDGIILHDMLFAPFFAGAAGTGHVWFWRQAIDEPDLWYHFARFAKVLDDIDVPEERFAPMMVPHENLRIYALKGNNTFIAWCRDSSNDWHKEFQEGIPPQEMRDISLDLLRYIDFSSEVANVYDPWQDVWTECIFRGNQLVLPDFKRSIVIRIESQ